MDRIMKTKIVWNPVFDCSVVKSAMVKYIPVAMRKTITGEMPRYARLGIRLNMKNGDWWFLSFKTGKWTFHSWELIRVPHSSTFKNVERKQTYTVGHLQTNLSVQILNALNLGVRLAFQSEMERRMEFGISRWGGLIPASIDMVNISDVADKLAA